MMRATTTAMVAAPMLLLLLLPASDARADAILVGVDFHAAADDPGNFVDFLLTFDRAPDFTSVPLGAGNAPDEFQFYPSDLVVRPPYVIRSGEIRTRGTIVVREGSPPSGDPGSGGWGALIAESAITNPTPESIAFRLPRHETRYDLLRPYRLFVFHDGLIGQSVGVLPGGGPLITVPEPGTLALCGLAGLGAVGLGAARRRRRRAA